MPLTALAVDGPLGRWTHTEWRPAPGDTLAGVVERVWHFDGAAAAPRERVFPDGCAELIVQLDAAYHVIGPGGVERCPAVNVGGVQTSAFVVVAPPGRTRVLGVRFRPAGAYAALALPLPAVRGLAVDLRDLVGAAADELAGRCHDAPNAAAAVRAAAAWVATRVARSPAADIAVTWAVAELQGAGGAVPIAALRDRVGVSPARFTAAFRDQVGLSPKRFARVVRFRRALGALHAGGRALSDVALAAGYYDQPHMNAEFRALAGLTPGEYLAAHRYPNSASVAEDAATG